jgi:hypothetical protein
VTLLARPRSYCTSKLLAHPLVREVAPQQETRNCQTENKNFVMRSRRGPETKTELELLSGTGCGLRLTSGLLVTRYGKNRSIDCSSSAEEEETSVTKTLLQSAHICALQTSSQWIPPTSTEYSAENGQV